MAKKKKAEVVQMLSPENYIRQKARTLPIHECWINEDWEESRMANITVARRHTNENLTYGLYLVDLNCLGVKDAHYRFNESELEYADFIQTQKQNMDVIRIDYELAHNIIFEAIEFALDYEFEPHKDFTKVAQYILEDDDECDVPIIDIECGVEGKPSYIRGPLDSDARARQIMAQLDRVAGKGNFDFITEVNKDDNFNEPWFDEDDDWDDEDDEDLNEDEWEEATDIFVKDEELVRNSSTLHFHIQLKGVKDPNVWRRIAVPSYASFLEFHLIIQYAFSWENMHLFQFADSHYKPKLMITVLNEEIDLSEDGEEMLESENVLLSDIFTKEGQQMAYLYDFGDNWEHDVILEKIEPKTSINAQLLDGEGACPVEDCGGAPGFDEFKKAINNPKHPRYKELREWLGLSKRDQWDVSFFDLPDINRSVEEIFCWR